MFIQPGTFYADLCTIKRSPVHVTETSTGEWRGIDLQKLRRKDIGRREHCPSAAYVSEFT